MTLKLIINSNNADDAAAISYAARLAKRLHTDLFAFSAMPAPETAVVFTGMDGSVALAGGAAESARKLQDERRELISDMFAETLKSENFPESHTRLEHYVGFPQHLSVDEAVLASAFVFPHSAADPASELGPAFRRVLMDAALPVVLAPESERDISTIVIAWDGSAEAARSLRLHLPLIMVHDRVVIAQNTRDLNSWNTGKQSDPEALKYWLASQQIVSEIKTFSGNVAEGLIGIAEETGADMIVAGAYGHSRIGEFLFGGATRGMLKKAKGAALALAH